MTAAAFRIVPLAAVHDRSTFASGSEPLDRYLQERVTQDIRRRITTCFVAVTPDERIAGYYTLASASLVLAELPPDTARRLPRYPPCAAIGTTYGANGSFGTTVDALAYDRLDSRYQ